MLEEVLLIPSIVLLFIGVFAFLVIVDAMMRGRRSQQYRKLLSDLYVAAKIKAFAKEDDIDLDIENERFKRWAKQQKILDKDVDLVVMEELKEKISQSNCDKVKKVDKK